MKIELAVVMAWMVLAPAAQAAPAAPAADPNAAGVQAVCGRCHGIERIFQTPPQSWERWNAIFGQMVRLGAQGSDAQLEQVTSYILDHLTTINVNSGAAEDIQSVLQVDDAVVQAIIARRQQKPFHTLSDLRAVPGVSDKRLALLGDRIQF